MVKKELEQRYVGILKLLKQLTKSGLRPEQLILVNTTLTELGIGE